MVFWPICVCKLESQRLISIDLMHWRHISITTTPCWGSRFVTLRARAVLEERWLWLALSRCAGPGRPGGMACRGWPAGCMLGDGARDSASFDPQHAGASFCDVICIKVYCKIQMLVRRCFPVTHLSNYTVKLLYSMNALISKFWFGRWCYVTF